MLDKSIPKSSKLSTDRPTPQEVDYVRVHNLGLPPLYGHYGDGGAATDYIVDLESLDSMPEIPPILSRSDGATLIPEGKLSSIYGLPSTGKSWVAVMVAVSVARSGGRAVGYCIGILKINRKRYSAGATLSDSALPTVASASNGVGRQWRMIPAH